MIQELQGYYVTDLKLRAELLRSLKRYAHRAYADIGHNIPLELPEQYRSSRLVFGDQSLLQ